MATTTALQDLRIGVTGARKGIALCEALERRGAIPLHGPTIEPDQPAPDAELLPQLEGLLYEPPDWFVANTGTGVRLLHELAVREELEGQLVSLLGDVRVVARGAKAVGGLRAIGLSPEHVSADETDASVADFLAGQLQPGQHLAVQYSGRTSPVYEELTSHGVTLHTLLPYRTGIPADDTPARVLIESAIDGHLDVLVSTSANAVDHMFTIAERHGLADDLRTALAGPVHAAAIGEVTAQALRDHAVEPRIIPARHRTGDLLRALESWHAAR